MFIDWKLSRNEKVCVGEYALEKEEILLADSTDNRSRLGQCWLLKKLAHESKTLGLALAPLCLHWQIVARSSKLGRESHSVNPALDNLH